MDPTLVEGNRETRLDAYRQLRDHLLSRLRARFPRARPRWWGEGRGRVLLIGLRT